MAENSVKIEEYSKTFVVGGCDVGPDDRLRLNILLRMVQETSDGHLAAVGVGFDKLMIEQGLVFLIITNAVKVMRMPQHYEEVTVTTHPRGSAGVLFYRDFVFRVGEEVVITVLQSSVAASTADHKVLRPKAFYESDLNQGVFPVMEMEKENRLSKLKIPEGLPKVGERPVRYSDLDRNDHLTNTMYGNILVDFAPAGMKDKTITEFQIDYVNESFLNETLEIRAVEENGSTLMAGYNPRGLAFSARLCLDARPAD